MRSVSSTPSSSSWNGSGVERERISSSSAWISISPVAIAGLTVSGERADDRPRARTTNSLRSSCAIGAASGEFSGLITTWTTPLLVAEVDEDEPAVVAAPRDPAGDA